MANIFEIGTALALYSMLAWGIQDFLDKKTLKEIKPLNLLFFQHLFSLIVLMPFAFNYLSSFVLNQSILLIILYGVLHIVAYYGMYTAFKKGKVSIMSPLVASYPIITILLALIIFKETLSIFKILGISLVIFGTIVISIEKVKDKMRTTKGLNYAALSMLAWAVIFFLWKPIVSIFEVILAIFLLRVSTVGLLLPSKFTLLNNFPRRLLVPILLIGILELSGVVTYAYANTLEQVSILVPIASAFPAVTIVLAWIFLKERPQKHQIIGILLLLPALVILSI